MVPDSDGEYVRKSTSDPPEAIERMWVVRRGNLGHLGGQTSKIARTSHFWPISMGVSLQLEGWIPGPLAAMGKINGHPSRGCRADMGSKTGPLGSFWWSNKQNSANRLFLLVLVGISPRFVGSTWCPMAYVGKNPQLGPF